MNEKPSSKELSPELVARYLKNHPGFFLEHEDLLIDLQLSRDSGNAVSLVERQVSLLRERNIELRDRLGELIKNAQKNDHLFEKTKTLILKILECHTIDELNTLFLDRLVNDYSMYAASLILFGERNTINTKKTRIHSLGEATEKIPAIIANNHAICGVLRSEELAFIFKDNHQGIGSAAVVDLNYLNVKGIIAIGSENPEYFKSSMGTLFLSYIADALSRQIARFI